MSKESRRKTVAKTAAAVVDIKALECRLFVCFVCVFDGFAKQAVSFSLKWCASTKYILHTYILHLMALVKTLYVGTFAERNLKSFVERKFARTL